jgi:hypothetical protein
MVGGTAGKLGVGSWQLGGKAEELESLVVVVCPGRWESMT